MMRRNGRTRPTSSSTWNAEGGAKPGRPLAAAVPPGPGGPAVAGTVNGGDTRRRGCDRGDTATGGMQRRGNEISVCRGQIAATARLADRLRGSGRQAQDNKISGNTHGDAQIKRAASSRPWVRASLIPLRWSPVRGLHDTIPLLSYAPPCRPPCQGQYKPAQFQKQALETSFLFNGLAHRSKIQFSELICPPAPRWELVPVPPTAVAAARNRESCGHLPR